jgi:iron(III) transport system permease protein
MRVGIILLLAWQLSSRCALGTLLSKASRTEREFVGLANYVRYFSTRACSLVFNSVWVAVVTTLIVIPLAFAYAYALTRSA